MKIRRSITVAATVVTAALAAATVTPAASAHAGGLPAPTWPPMRCRCGSPTPVPPTRTMWGQLCYRGDREPGTVQLLVHGATYNHLYWNFPYSNGYYSYVDAATAAGYATFDIDGIGPATAPTRPPGLTVDAAAMALHDAVTALRTGGVDGHPFQHVIIVGHSLGSAEAWIGAPATTTWTALSSPAPCTRSAPPTRRPGRRHVPGADDPEFAGSGLDPGYLTTLPGTRESVFYDPATASPLWSQPTKRTRTLDRRSSPAQPQSSASHQPSSPPTRSPCLSCPSSAKTTTSSAPAVTAYNCADPAIGAELRSPVLPAASAPESRGNPRHRARPRPVHHRPARRRGDDRLVAVDDRSLSRTTDATPHIDERYQRARANKTADQEKRT